MQEEYIKINPKLIKPLMEVLDLLDEERRMRYTDDLLADVEQTIAEAQRYAKSKKIDYKTSLRHVLATKEPAIFCKDGF